MMSADGMPSEPAALPFFKMSDGFQDLYFAWSVLIDLQRCVGWFEVGQLAWRRSLKCLAHLSLLFLIGEHLSAPGSFKSIWGLLAPSNVFVMEYSSLLSPFPAASSACLARSSTKFRRSYLVLLLTPLLASKYLIWASDFLALILLRFSTSFTFFPGFYLFQSVRPWIGLVLFALPSQRFLTSSSVHVYALPHLVDYCLQVLPFVVACFALTC